MTAPAAPSNAAPGRLLKMQDVVREVSLHRATIYRLISADQFPKPRQISRGRVAWLQAEVEAWKIAAINGANPQQ